MISCITSRARGRARTFAIVSSVAVAALAFAAAPASATKYFDSFFGGTGPTGGLFSTSNSGIGDVTVNDPSIATDGATQAGWVYVVDSGNRRIQAFNASGAFQFAIGRDVITNGSPSDPTNVVGFQKCTVAADCKVGTAGSLGGEFDIPLGIDVDQATGHFFVSERAASAAAVTGRRVQEFTADGQFVRAFGRDVVQPGGTGEVLEGPFDEEQLVSIGFFSGSVTGGTFTLTFNGQTTTPIAHDATPVALQAALVALSNIGDNDVLVSTATPVLGTRAWTVKFAGALAASDQPQMTINGTGLTGGSTPIHSVITTTPGGFIPGFETCTVAAQCKGGTAGRNPGQFGDTIANTINGLAVAPPGAPPNVPNTTRVYVVDPVNTRFLPFDVPTNPTAAVTAVAPLGEQGQTANNHFLPDTPKDLAVGPDGVVYASTGGPRVVRYDAQTGTFLNRVEPQPVGPFSSATINGMEIDRATGHLLVSRTDAEGIVELDVSGKPTDVTATDVVDAHAAGMGFSGTPPLRRAIGVNPATGEYYFTVSLASTPSLTGTGHRVLMIDDNGVDPQSTSTLLPPTDVGCNSATFGASVNPNGPTGIPTSYRFEISTDGIDWTVATPDQSVGDGGVAVPITRAVAGLEANALYRVRLVTSRAPAAGLSVSPEVVFATDACAPTAETLPASGVEDDAAQLAGRVNPNGRETHYWFEWGDDSYGSRTPVAAAGAGGKMLNVGHRLVGLVPESAYHYRLCAENVLVSEPICGADHVFMTRAKADPALVRSDEMVTSPAKVVRRGGDNGNAAGDVDFTRFEAALNAPDGGSVLWGLYAAASDPADNAWSGDVVFERRSRADRDGDGIADGWYGEAVINIPPLVTGQGAVNDLLAVSEDLSTYSFKMSAPLFASGAQQSTHMMGDDDGGPRNAGWYPWVDPAWLAGSLDGNVQLSAQLGDSGGPMVGWAFQGPQALSAFRDVTPSDDTIPPQALTPAQTQGQALFATDLAHDWRPADLINECTGIGASATTLPSRQVDGSIGAIPCEDGSPTSTRGAALGGMTSGTNNRRLRGAGTAAVSHSGDRMFFVSPEPDVTGTGQVTCGTGTLAATACPAQLFVRQLDDAGNATVRWLSRAESSLFSAPQAIGAFGNGVSFEGASTDGDVVYFRTNAPLVSNDPNGGGSVLTTASPVSWDLYRYELPGDNNIDPAGGSLTRVSAGPAGTADPNTTCSSTSANCGGTANGEGTAVRFMSDDGERVYFATTSRIGSAGDPWNARPKSGVTDPGGVTTDTTARNLYLYDATKAGNAAYRFIARVPSALPGASVDACASTMTSGATSARRISPLEGRLTTDQGGSCVHGTRSGDAMVFETTAPLTDDDTDGASDVYLYDADADELVRLSAPEPGAEAYMCLGTESVPLGVCNGDLGLANGSAVGNQAGVPRGTKVGLNGMRNYNIAENPDGTLRAVYFESRLPLDDGDGDDLMDVYEWRAGERNLVSRKTDDHSAFYSGNSRDGDDVFYWTQQRISRWEIDAADGDVYDAKSDGGLPDPISFPTPCDVFAGVCQPTTSAPIGTAPVTGGDAGGGNAPPAVRKTLSVKQPSKAQRKRAASRGILRLQVTTGATGRVSATARAKLSGRTLVVARRSTRVTGGRTTALNLRLSRAARRALRRGRALSLEIKVTTPGAHARILTVDLKGAKS